MYIVQARSEDFKRGGARFQMLLCSRKFWKIDPLGCIFRPLFAKRGGGEGPPPPPLWPPMNVHETNVFNLTGRYKITKLVGGGENVTTKPYHSFMCTEFSKWGEKTRMTPPPIMAKEGGEITPAPPPCAQSHQWLWIIYYVLKDFYWIIQEICLQ